MTDLIDRGALRSYFEQNPEADFSSADVVRTIDYMPTVDAAPVVHARWTSKTNWTLDRCSNCGKSGFPEWPYCPGCGAKMRMDADAPERAGKERLSDQSQ